MWINKALQKCSGYCSCSDIPKLDAPLPFGERFCYDQNEMVVSRGLLSRAEQVHSDKFERSVRGAELHQLLMLEVCSPKSDTVPRTLYD